MCSVKGSDRDRNETPASQGGDASNGNYQSQSNRRRTGGTTAKRRSTSARSTAAKRTTAKRSTAARSGSTRRKAASTRRSAAAKRGAATRTRNQAPTPGTAKVARRLPEQVADAAERAVLIPVGAALTARDRVVETVADLGKSYGTRESAQKTVERDLKRYERRGTTARNRVEREVKKTRTRVERELRQRRTRVQRVVKRNRTRVEREAKSVRRDFENQAGKAASTAVAAQADLVSARVENAVSVAQQVAAKAQERVANVA